MQGSKWRLAGQHLPLRTSLWRFLSLIWPIGSKGTMPRSPVCMHMSTFVTAMHTSNVYAPPQSAGPENVVVCPNVAAFVPAYEGVLRVPL